MFRLLHVVLSLKKLLRAPFANSDVTTKDCVVLFQIILNTLFIKRFSQTNRPISCCEAKIMQTKQVNSKVFGVYRS